MMQLIWRFFERATPRVENAAIAVSERRATFHEDIRGNKTTVFEYITWSGNETAGPLMFRHNAAQRQQLTSEQHDNQRRTLPYHQQVTDENQRRRRASVNRWPVADDDF